MPSELTSTRSGLTRHRVSDLPRPSTSLRLGRCPAKLHLPDYPAHFETRKVSTNGGIRWHSAWVNVSHLLGGEYIGFEEVADDIWTVPSCSKTQPSFEYWNRPG